MQSDEESAKMTSDEGASLHGLKNMENREDGKRNGTDYDEEMIESFQQRLTAIPESLRSLLGAFSRPGDCGRPLDERPDWLDMDKFRRGQKFAQNHLFAVFYSELMGLLTIYSFQDGLRPIILAETSSTPTAAFKRFVSTASRFLRWCTQDPWTKGTHAAKDIMVVRAMHCAMIRKLADHTNEEIDKRVVIPNASCPTRENIIKDLAESCESPTTGQCPYIDLKDDPNRPKNLHQVDMVATQWSLTGLLVLHPKSFGIHYATDEELESFCYLWRCLGYLLGIEDEYNFCRGSLAEIRQRSSDFIEYWLKPNFPMVTPEWEHMSRCLIDGMSSVTKYPLFSFETVFFHLTEMINLRMPRFYNSLSYVNRITYHALRLFLTYGVRIPGVYRLFNNLLKKQLIRAAKLNPEKLTALNKNSSNKTENKAGKRNAFREE